MTASPWQASVGPIAPDSASMAAAAAAASADSMAAFSIASARVCSIAAARRASKRRSISKSAVSAAAAAFAASLASASAESRSASRRVMVICVCAGNVEASSGDAGIELRTVCDPSDSVDAITIVGASSRVQPNVVGKVCSNVASCA
eukprot:scaffold16454_cov25-Tisochrysis_lutea.AAC.2